MKRRVPAEAKKRQERAARGHNPVSREVLVGLTGPAGCGKDTIANLMLKHGQFDRYALASPIKEGLWQMLDIPMSTWRDRTAKEAVIPWLGKSPRQLAQTLGTEWGRQQVHPEIWIKLMQRRWKRVQASANPRMVVSDVRFDNEAQAINDAGGTVWRVDRPKGLPVATHSSEVGVSGHLVTGVVHNTGTVYQLEVVVMQWVNFLLTRYAR